MSINDETDFVARIRASYAYDPETGNFTYLSNRLAGKRAGCLRNGRVILNVCGTLMPAGIICLAHATGTRPKYVLHLDGDQNNLRLNNLQPVATRSELQRLNRPDDNNGIKVCGERFQAIVRHHGARMGLGTFGSLEAAQEARAKALREIAAGLEPTITRNPPVKRASKPKPVKRVKPPRVPTPLKVQEPTTPKSPRIEPIMPTKTLTHSYAGHEYTVKELADKAGISKSAMSQRLSSMSVDDAMRKKRNAIGSRVYLNNKDLLAEVAKSKISFCSFIGDEYAVPDFIVSNDKEVRGAVEEGRRARAERLGVEVSEIPTEDVVVRVMSWTHVPYDPTFRKRHNVTEENAGKARTSFQPFKHVIIRDDEIVEVGRSHWQGGLDNGWYSTDHGKVTDKLARMMMLLVQQLSSKGSWRGYSYVDEMRSSAVMQLYRVGLQFDETKSENVFAYWTTIAIQVFRRVLALEKRQATIRDDLLIGAGMTPSHARQQADHDVQYGEGVLAQPDALKVITKRGRPKQNR